MYIKDLINKILDRQYEQYCPKPTQFPNGANWYAIDSDGQSSFYVDKPDLDFYGWSGNEVESVDSYDLHDLPLGVDWRLCCYSIHQSINLYD